MLGIHEEEDVLTWSFRIVVGELPETLRRARDVAITDVVFWGPSRTSRPSVRFEDEVSQ